MAEHVLSIGDRLPTTEAISVIKRSNRWRKLPKMPSGTDRGRFLREGFLSEPRPPDDYPKEFVEVLAESCKFGGVAAEGLVKILMTGELVRTPDGFVQRIQGKGVQEIAILIRDGLGGCGNAADEILAVLNGRPKGVRLTLRLEGIIASGHAIIGTLAQGHRVMNSNAKLLLHRMTAFAHGDGSELRAVAERLEEAESRIVSEFVSRTGQSRAVVRGWFISEKNATFSAEAALELGLIDEILPATTGVGGA